MPRLTVSGLQIRGNGPQTAAAPVDPYVRVSLPSADFSGQPDLSSFSKTFSALAAQHGEDRRKALQAQGTEFAQNEGAKASAAESAIADSISDAKDPAERLRRTKLAIGKLIDSGVLPSAASSPVFQIGLSQAVARDLANKARNELLGRVHELTVIRDAKDGPVPPPDLQKVLDQAFGKYADSPSVRDNAFGRQVFGELRQRYSEEFSARVAEERAPALEREQSRLAVGEVVNGSELGKGLAQIEATGTFTADDVAGIERMADDFFTNRHIRDVRPLLLEAFSLRVAEAADTDPGAALGLIDLARQVKVAGVPLGEDVESEAKLVDLEQRVQDRRLALQNRQLSRQGAVEGVVRDRLRGAGLAAIAQARATGSDPVGAAEDALRSASTDSSVVGYLSELGYTSPPAWLVGEVRAGLQETARSSEVASARSDPSALRSLQLSQVDGTDPEHLRAQWDAAFRSGSVSFADYQSAVDRIDNVGDVLSVRNGVPEYQVLLASIQADQRVASGLADPDRDALGDEYAASLNALDGLVESAAAGKTSTADIVRAVRRAVSSPEAVAARDKFRLAVRAADERRLAAEKGVQDQIAAFDTAGARSAIDAARGVTVSRERAIELDQQVAAREREVDRATLSPVVEDARQGLVALLKARLSDGVTDPADPSTTLDLDDSAQAGVVADALEQFDRASSQAVKQALRAAGSDEFGATLRPLLKAATDAILEPLKNPTKPAPSGGSGAPGEAPAGPTSQALQDALRRGRLTKHRDAALRVEAGEQGPSSAVLRHDKVPAAVHTMVDAARSQFWIPFFVRKSGSFSPEFALREQDLTVMSLAPEDQGAAEASLAGQRFIPAEDVLAGRTSITAVLPAVDPPYSGGLDFASWAGVPASEVRKPGDPSPLLDRISERFHGAAVTLQPGVHGGWSTVTIKQEVDLSGQEFNPFLMAMWRTEKDMNAFLSDDAKRAALLSRFGMEERDVQEFRRAQAAAIKRIQ